jgi:DNA-binding GntR family transcriptional regulator
MPLPINDSPPLERRLLRDVVYDRLYAAIVEGTLVPGETLPDERLTSWLGVSRTPIREALMKLADIGLVEVVPNHNTRVTPIDHRAIDEAVYTTGLLHEHAVRAAVPGLDDAAVSRLDVAQKEVKMTAMAGDKPALGRALNEFFLEFARGAGNAVLLGVSEGLSPQLLRYIAVWPQPFGVDDLPARVTAIFEAAKARDGQKAGDLVAELYAPTLTQFLTEYRLSNRDIDETPGY